MSQNKLQFRRVWKHCKSYLHSESNGRNHDLKKGHNNWNGAHHRSRNFLKAKMCQNKQQFRKFENIVNLIYTAYAISEMMFWTTFTMVSMVRITGVEIS